jgi:PAS domain S-box-containing protein
VNAIAITDAHGRIYYANPSFVQLWRYDDASEVIGRTPGDFAADPADAQAIVEAMFGSGSYIGEMKIRRKDGSTGFVDLSASVVRDDTGAVTHLMASFVDITLRKQQEQALRDGEARISAAYATLNDAIESAPAAIAVFDTDDRLIAFNSHLSGLMHDHGDYVRTGITFREMVERFSADNAIVEPARAGTDWLDERCRMHLNPAGPMEVRVADGRWLQIIETRTHEGGVVTVYNDISDLKGRETELRRLANELETRVAERTAELAEANRELDSFASTVAHDLRAPLRGIDGFGKLLDDRLGAGLDAESRGFLQRMRASAQRMGSIIDELLKFSRIGRSELRCRWVDLSLLARAVADDLQRSTPQRRVEWTIAPGMRTWADPELLHLVMENLIGNAWKYTGKTAEPRIEIGTARDDAGRDEFFVRDNGAGFDMAHAQLLFQPFRRLHGQHEFEGTGIGLATVQRIVQRHGGAICGHGVVGQGAEFRFVLPAPR